MSAEIVCPHCGESYASASEEEAGDVETIRPDLQFIPAHRHILEASGWLGYVEANLDVLQYYPWREFAHPTVGSAIGLALYENGRRVAQIATEGWDDMTVVSVIVHEAAHLAGIAQQGTYFSEDIAAGIQRRFLSDAHAKQRRLGFDSEQAVGWFLVGGLFVACILALQMLVSESWSDQTVVVPVEWEEFVP